MSKYDYDLDKLIQSSPNTVLTPGAEFRHIEAIRKLWQHREDWKEIEPIIKKGCEYPIDIGPSLEEKRSDLDYMIKYGNHKSACSKEGMEAIDKSYKKEVKFEWMIPITIESIYKIKNAGVITLGVAT